MLFGSFVPSKTGKNGLNFVRTEDENNLVNKEQPEEILEFFKVIYVLLKEPFKDIPKNELIIYMKNTLFPKFGVDSFSKQTFLNIFLIETLIISYMVNNVSISEEQYNSLCTIYQTNPKILNSSDFLKLNRSVSYMTFIIKELFDYCTAKTIDGLPIFKLRESAKKIQNLKDDIEKMHKYLKV